MKRWVAGLHWIGIGWFMALCIASGVVGGYWLDHAVHTKPLFILLGLGLGILVAFFGVYRSLRPLLRQRQDKDKDKDREGK
jgi:F0F1-type ATP synthase assembly protein I